MAADDRMFFTVAGCVLVMAAAAFILVGVAPPVGSSHLATAAPTQTRTTAARAAELDPVQPEPADQVRERPMAPAAAEGIGEAGGARKATNRSAGTDRSAGVEWLSASFDLSSAASEASGADADLARLAEIIDAAAEGHLADGEQGLRLPWDSVLVRDASDGRTVLAAGTFRHYDTWVASLEQLDLERLGRLVVALDAGNAPGIEASLRRAVHHLLQLEVPAAPVEMESHVTRWVLADDELRQLSPMQKHLLLMGPANAHTVQARLHELEQVLGWPRTDAQPALDIEAEAKTNSNTEIETDRPSPGPPLLASNEIGEPDGSALDQATAE